MKINKKTRGIVAVIVLVAAAVGIGISVGYGPDFSYVDNRKAFATDDSVAGGSNTDDTYANADSTNNVDSILRYASASDTLKLIPFRGKLVLPDTLQGVYVWPGSDWGDEYYDYLPKIPSLAHRIVASRCPKDKCTGYNMWLAIGPVEHAVEANWLNRRVQQHLDTLDWEGIPGKKKTTIRLAPAGIDSQQICEHYAEEMERLFAEDIAYDSPLSEHGSVPEETQSMLITRAWHNEHYTTFSELTFYDRNSNGCNWRQNYVTIDRRTGKTLTISDFVAESDMQRLALLTVLNLRALNSEPYMDYHTNLFSINGCVDLLGQADGVALCAEGLVVYFHPYTISAGFLAELYAVIPHSQLRLTID